MFKREKTLININNRFIFAVIMWRGRVPVVPIVGYPILRLLNLSARRCLSEDPDAHAKLIQHTCQVLKMDACLPLLDLTVEAELLGAPVEFSEHDAPSIVRRLDIDQVRRIDNLGRVTLFAETVKRASASYDKPLGPYVTGPFTVYVKFSVLSALCYILLGDLKESSRCLI